MLQLILYDDTVIEIVEAGYTKHFVVVVADSTEFKDIWDAMTDENLSEVRITDDGELIHTILGMHLDGTQTVENPDGTLTGHFYMTGGWYAEDEYATAGRIMFGEG